ncbi:MAG TPA: septal ring lytic transglycosylase RlpA family protein [Candidatus Acidoferrales bacterium]|nr:septal ring lytic transglycosylase RlpA family protein [Candidatus Acidoferrales bacterium]
MTERLTARVAPFLRLRWLAFGCIAVLMAAGCAGRRPVSTVPAPTPSPNPQPVPAPAPVPSGPPSAPSASQPPTRSSPFVPGIFVEEGTASWYGIPFNGRRAANGEIFDMNTLVAAHRTLPFGSILRVTNLNNGREVEVRVIDRGPFVGNRVLDLARAAAVSLDMIGTGTAPVRIELISGSNPSTGDFTVQVGAFADRANAERLRDRLLAQYQPIFIQDYETPTGHFYRVRVGRVSNPDAAQQLATRLKSSDGFQTFVMRLDQPSDLGNK